MNSEDNNSTDNLENTGDSPNPSTVINGDENILDLELEDDLELNIEFEDTLNEVLQARQSLNDALQDRLNDLCSTLGFVNVITAIGKRNNLEEVLSDQTLEDNLRDSAKTTCNTTQLIADICSDPEKSLFIIGYKLLLDSPLTLPNGNGKKVSSNVIFLICNDIPEYQNQFGNGAETMRRILSLSGAFDFIRDCN